MIKLVRLLAILATFILVSGFTECYKPVTNSGLPKEIRKVAVPPFQFEARALRYRLESRFTDAVVREVIKRGQGLRVQGTTEGADAVVEGSLRDFGFSGVQLDRTGRARVYEIAIVGTVTVRSTKDNKILYDNQNFIFRDSFEFADDPRTFFNEEDPAVERIARASESVVSAIINGFVLKKKESEHSKKNLMSKINGFAFISPDKWRFLNNAEVEQSAHRANEYVERGFHFDNLEYRIEEYLRQWILVQLTDVYGYPENWLWLAKNAKRNANIVIKDQSNRSLALVAARYFGESDLEFEQAGHDLQSDLEAIETVRFGLITDGRRIAFICKNGDDQIGDYKTIADFPAYSELKKILETNQFPNSPLTTNKFQKLPASERPAKPVAAPIQQQRTDKKLISSASSKLKNKSRHQRRGAAILCVISLILLGAWYVTESESKVDAQQSATSGTTTIAQPAEKKEIFTPRVSGQNSAAGKSLSAPTVSRGQNQKASKSAAPRETNVDGSLKLSREEVSLMQNRPAANPNARNQQSKVVVQPASPDEVPANGRKIIRQPFTTN